MVGKGFCTGNGKVIPGLWGYNDTTSSISTEKGCRDPCTSNSWCSGYSYGLNPRSKILICLLHFASNTLDEPSLEGFAIRGSFDKIKIFPEIDGTDKNKGFGIYMKKNTGN